MQPKKLEQQLLETLSNPQSEPKYSLWQQVEFKRYEEVLRGGRIVGYYWQSVAYSFRAGEDYFGWYYLVETERDLYHVEENQITVVEVSQ